MKSLNEWLYPEMKHLPRWSDRQAAMWAFQPRIFRDWRVWIAFILMIPVGASMPWLVNQANRFLPGALSLGGGIFQAVVGGALQGLTFAFTFNYLFRKPTRRFLREYLNERGHNLCVPCGYDLRGQTTPRCPECGAEFDASRLTNIPASSE